MIPDPIERGEMRAEAAAERLMLPNGHWKCYQCDAVFDAELGGGVIVNDPYAPPVCPTCFDKAWDEAKESE